MSIRQGSAPRYWPSRTVLGSCVAFLAQNNVLVRGLSSGDTEVMNTRSLSIDREVRDAGLVTFGAYMVRVKVMAQSKSLRVQKQMLTIPVYHVCDQAS